MSRALQEERTEGERQSESILGGTRRVMYPELKRKGVIMKGLVPSAKEKEYQPLSKL
jgi:hypothetical protein